MRRGAIVEVLEVGEVTVADVVAARTGGPSDAAGDDTLPPVEELPVVRA